MKVINELCKQRLRLSISQHLGWPESPCGDLTGPNSLSINLNVLGNDPEAIDGHVYHIKYEARRQMCVGASLKTQLNQVDTRAPSAGAGRGRQDDMAEVNQLQHLSKKPDESRCPDPGAARMSVRALTNQAKIGKMLSIRDAGCFSGALPR